MGPLAGYRVVEFAGIGPGPMCAMLLADMGATVLRVERPGAGPGIPGLEGFDIVNRGRRSVCIGLKRPEGVSLALDLIAKADALIEGFRPGAMERLGLGPDVCLGRNPRLIYGRMTGWGQEGPLAKTAGHDLNYIALAGVLDAIGRAGGPPTPPLNLVGDYGGGALYLAFGIVCGILEARKSGQGQVIDAAMIDGAASLMTPFFGLHAAGLHNAGRGENVLDSGAPYYEVYACADGRYLAVAPIEAKFRSAFYQRAGIDEASLPDAGEAGNWPAIKTIIAATLAAKTRDEWCAAFDGTDTCVTPVLSTGEAPQHPHHRARGAFVEIDGIMQPAPAPRFSRTKPDTPAPPEAPGESWQVALAEWGIADGEIQRLAEAGVIGR